MNYWRRCGETGVLFIQNRAFLIHPASQNNISIEEMVSTIEKIVPPPPKSAPAADLRNSLLE